ncbi:hypothetical protein EDD86DRAFT_197650 [Gorgonomyces haynaldii]|nr:hypothetical protein EDD86DRAFT_197650 [Gorgonomyces haynaldii]
MLSKLTKLSRFHASFFDVKSLLGLCVLYGISYVGVLIMEQEFQSIDSTRYTAQRLKDYISGLDNRNWYPLMLLLETTMMLSTCLLSGLTLSFVAGAMRQQQLYLDSISKPEKSPLPKELNITLLNLVPDIIIVCELIEKILISILVWTNLDIYHLTSKWTAIKWNVFRLAVSFTIMTLLTSAIQLLIKRVRTKLPKQPLQQAPPGLTRAKDLGKQTYKNKKRD